MKIHYCSDLHLEFGKLTAANTMSFPKHGELLLLCGDITLTAAYADSREGLKDLRERTHAFINDMLARFSRVIFFPGNHEAYHSDYTEIEKMMSEEFPALTLGQNRTFDLAPGYKLFCSTLWTDLNGGRARPQLNDYRIVRFGGHVMTYDDTAKMHKTAMEELEQSLAAHPNHNFVIATHHCPSAKCLNTARYSKDGNTEFGYYTPLDNFIRSHPQITHWVCGHTHKVYNGRIGNCRLLMNPRGYMGHAQGAETWKLRSFKLPSPSSTSTT
jgi:predicted phosphodiesterase